MTWLTLFRFAAFSVLICYHSGVSSVDICSVHQCTCDFRARTIICHGQADLVFEGIPSLPIWTEHLHICNLGLSALPDRSFHGAKWLISIRINNCGLNFMQPLTFHGLMKLQILNLSHNELAILPARVFVDLPKLTLLDLSMNRISNLDQLDRVVHSDKVLDELHLSNNPICNVNFYSRIPLTRQLHMSHLKSAFVADESGMLFAQSEQCRIPDCRHLSFSSRQFLLFDKVDFSHNIQMHLSESFLNSAKNISVLNVAGIHLPNGTVFQTVLKSLPRLQSLNISISHIEHLNGWTMFSPSLEVLDISNLELLSLNVTGSNLRHLTANDNQLINVILSLKTTNLESLSLSGNHLTALPDIPPGFTLPFLTRVNLAGNHISALGPYSLYPYRNLTFFDLSNNHVEIVSKLAFPVIGLQMTCLDISGNRMRSLPRFVQPNLKLLNVSHNQLRTLDVYFFEGLPRLEFILLDHNNDLMHSHCHDVSHLIDSFDCYPIWLQSLATVGRLIELDLSNTGLMALPLPLLAKLPTLQTLRLAGNQLTTQVFNQWTLRYCLPRNLRSLDISGNRLRSLGDSELFVNQLVHLKQFDFSLNPLECSCSLANLKQLADNNVIRNFDDDNLYFCLALPNRWQYPLKSFVEQLLPCVDDTDSKMVILKTFGFFVAVIFGVTTIYVVMCKICGIFLSRKWERDIQYLYQPLATWANNLETNVSPV